MPSAAGLTESLRRLAPSPVVTEPSAANGFSRPFATPDEGLVKLHRKIPRRSPTHRASGQLRRPAAGAQVLEPLRRAGRPSASLWPQQTGLASTTGLAGQADHTKRDRARQRRRRGGNHVCSCQICGERMHKPSAASEQLARLETKWAELRDHAVWKDEGFTGQALKGLEKELDRIRKRLASEHDGAGQPEPQPQAQPEPQPEPQPESEQPPELELLTMGAIDTAVRENVESSVEAAVVEASTPTPIDAAVAAAVGDQLAANEAANEAAAAEQQQLVIDAKDPEKLIAAAKAGNPDDVSALIDAGANVNEAKIAIVLAAAGGHDATVSVLLKAGADGMATHDGVTVLQLVQEKYREVASSPPEGGMGAHRDLLEGLKATELALETWMAERGEQDGTSTSGSERWGGTKENSGVL